MLKSTFKANYVLTEDIYKADAITHAGTQHADDVMASAILCILNEIRGNEEPLKIYRARDQRELEGIGIDSDKNPIIFDIGFGEFDHHQKGGNGRRENGIPYASAGLLWKRFGLEICKAFGFEMPDLIDESIIQAIDARDNGVEIHTVAVIDGKEVPISPYTVSSVIAARNGVYAPVVAFSSAVAFAYTALATELTRQAEIWSTENRDMILGAVENAENHIIVLEKYVPWKNWLHKLSKVYHDCSLIQAVIYPSARGGYQWMLVPKDPDSFETKISTPKEICGLDREALRKVFPDAVFIHPTGFSGANETLAGASQVANYIVNSNKEMTE